VILESRSAISGDSFGRSNRQLFQLAVLDFLMELNQVDVLYVLAARIDELID
jgi:hypothetical protein